MFIMGTFHFLVTYPYYNGNFSNKNDVLLHEMKTFRILRLFHLNEAISNSDKQIKGNFYKLLALKVTVKTKE